MRVRVHLWSYFRELAGSAQLEVEVPADSTVATVLDEVYRRCPPLGALRNATLIAVGVEYAGASHRLVPGEEVSLFPPVQGG